MSPKSLTRLILTFEALSRFRFGLNLRHVQYLFSVAIVVLRSVRHFSVDVCVEVAQVLIAETFQYFFHLLIYWLCCFIQASPSTG